MYALATNDNAHLYDMIGTPVVNYGGQGLGQAWGAAFDSKATPPVPQPETYAMMLAGFAMMAKRRKA